MSNYSVGVVAEQRYKSRYEVYCNRCKGSIGIMDFRTIREAIFNTLGRGGVLCPDCRCVTCDGCGLEPEPSILAVVWSSKGQLRFCQACNESITREITGSSLGNINWEEEIKF